LKAGEILFRSEAEERDFYVVVEGTVNVFVKGPEASSPDALLPDDNESLFLENDSEDELDGMETTEAETDYNDKSKQSSRETRKKSRYWPGHHLLNEVKPGGTISSLFAILSVFTDDVAEPKTPMQRAKEARMETSLGLGVPPDHHDLKEAVNGGVAEKSVDGDTSLIMEGVSEVRVPDMNATNSDFTDGADSVPVTDISHSELTDSTSAAPGGSQTPKKPKMHPVFPSMSASNFAESPTLSASASATTNPLPSSLPLPPNPLLNTLKSASKINTHIVARAATDATLAVIPAEAFRKLTEKFPNAAAHIVQVILTRFQRVTFMTLHRYLGLSKELLKIEKRVNEFAGYGLPLDFFSPGALEKLKGRQQQGGGDGGTDSESQRGGDINYDSAAESGTDSGAPSTMPTRNRGTNSTYNGAPSSSMSNIRKRVIGSRAKLGGGLRKGDSYEADLDDSEKESGAGFPPMNPYASVSSSYQFPAPTSTHLGNSRNPMSSSTSRLSNFQTYQPSVPGLMRNSMGPGHAGASPLSAGPQGKFGISLESLEGEEDAQLKESVFDCISAIIGMVPTASQQLLNQTHPNRKDSNASTSMPSSAQFRASSRTSMSDILFTSAQARQRATFTAGDHLSSRRSSIDSQTGLDDHFDVLSVSSVGGYSASGSEADRTSTSLHFSAHQNHQGGSFSQYSQGQNHGGPGSEIRIVSLRRGEVLVKEGERPSGLWFCVDGVLEASILESSEPFVGPGDLGAALGGSAGRGGSSGGGSKKKGKAGVKKNLFLIKPGGLAGYLAVMTGHPSFVTIRAKTDCHLGFLPKHYLDRYIEKYPNVLLTLAKRLITQLSPLVLHIDVALEWGTVNSGQVLCRQGEASDSIYIVLNGRLRSIAERLVEDGEAVDVEQGLKEDIDGSTAGGINGANLSPKRSSNNVAGSKYKRYPTDTSPSRSPSGIFSSHQKAQRSYEILGEYGKGDSVGELEVLTDTARPATVHAIRDTEIAVMPKTLFNALAIRHPEITFQISRIIAARARGLHSGAYNNSAGVGRKGGVPVSLGSLGGASFASWNMSTLTSSGGLEANSANNVNLKTVAIIPVNSAVPIADFAERLKAAVDLLGDSVVLLNTANVMSKLGKHAFSRLGRLKLVSWLAEQEDTYRLVLYVADSGIGSPWTQRCVRQVRENGLQVSCVSGI
jgi:lysophospholipid hydrolase